MSAALGFPKHSVPAALVTHFSLVPFGTWSKDLSRFETGEREPPLEVLLRYSQLANVWINALVDDAVDLPSKLPCNRMHAGTKRDK